MLKILAALWLLGSVGGACDTIGFNNFNPGNLSRGNCQWKSASGTDAWGHLQFRSDKEGLQAIQKVLIVYKRKYHINTLERLTGRWVSTKATLQDKINWLRTVRQRVGCKPGQKLNFYDPETERRIAQGIVWAENSCDSIDPAIYAAVFLKE